MALSSTSRPSLRAKVLSRLPASLTATGGLKVDKSNGVWTFAPDWTGLQLETTIPDPEGRQVWTYNSADDEYTRLSVQALIDSLPAGPSGADGSLIFSQNSAPDTAEPEGSIWIDADSVDLDLYQLISSVWTDTGVNLKGATGATGATGSTVGTSFVYDTTTTDSDPGSGKFRFNNATISSVTAGYFDNNDSGGSSVSSWLDTFDDSTNTTKGQLTVRGVTTASAWAVFSVTGSVVDGTGYRKITLTYIASGGTWTNGDTFAFSFASAGNKGADGAGNIGGSSGATDNALVRADGTGGVTIQSSAIIVDDSGNVSGVANLTTTGNIELGNASDTTISRAAAGVISVEGVPLYSNIPQNSQSAAYTFVLADAGKDIFHPAADTTARTWTIPANSSVAYPVGSFIALSGEALSGNITLAITTDTLVWVPSGSTGSRTLTAPFQAVLIKKTSTKWFLTGVGIT